MLLHAVADATTSTTSTTSTTLTSTASTATTTTTPVKFDIDTSNVLENLSPLNNIAIVGIYAERGYDTFQPHAFMCPALIFTSLGLCR